MLAPILPADPLATDRLNDLPQVPASLIYDGARIECLRQGEWIPGTIVGTAVDDGRYVIDIDLDWPDRSGAKQIWTDSLKIRPARPQRPALWLRHGRHAVRAARTNPGHRGRVTSTRRPNEMTAIRDYDPTKGCAFQGDVSIVPIPAGIAITTTDEISPRDGKLILQEGEMTGHHHYLLANVARFRDDGLARDLAVKSEQPLPTARLYRDPAVPAEMVRRGILTRADLAVACLVVEGGPMVVSHQEHDGIRLPVGRYLIGRQVESAGEDERRVED